MTFARTRRRPPGPVTTDGSAVPSLGLSDAAGCAGPLGVGDMGVVGTEDAVGVGFAVGALDGSSLGDEPGAVGDGDVEPSPAGVGIAWYVRALLSVVGVLPYLAYTATS